jgi:hypothetical protein
MVGNIVDVGWATIRSGCLPITDSSLCCTCATNVRVCLFELRGAPVYNSLAHAVLVYICFGLFRFVPLHVRTNETNRIFFFGGGGNS